MRIVIDKNNKKIHCIDYHNPKECEKVKLEVKDNKYIIEIKGYKIQIDKEVIKDFLTIGL